MHPVKNIIISLSTPTAIYRLIRIHNVLLLSDVGTHLVARVELLGV
jgi:hypothetical protein